MEDLREGAAILHVGAKRTGKTTASLRMMVDDFWANQKKPCIVLDLNNNPDFQSLTPISIEEVTTFSRRRHGASPFYVVRPDADYLLAKDSVLRFCQAVTLYVRNTAVIFDDFTTYLEGNIPSVIKNMILGVRPACNDYVFNVHSFVDVGPFPIRHCEVYMVRFSFDNPNELTSKIPEAVRPLVRQVMLEIERENRHIPKDKPRLAYRIIKKDEGRIVK